MTNETNAPTSNENTAADVGQVDPATLNVANSEVAAKKVRKTIVKADLTPEYVREHLELRVDEFDGPAGEDGQPTKMKFDNFYWLKDTPASRKGDFAGSRRPVDGYYSVVLAGTNYSGAQLACFHRTGAWPVKGPKVEAEKPVKEHIARVFVPLTEEQRVAAKAAAKVKADAAKAAKASNKTAAETAKSAEPAAAPESTAAEPSTATADTSDIDAAVL